MCWPIFEPGHYWFVGLEPGTYIIREVVPEGFEQTFPTSDDAAIDGVHKVVLEPGDEVRGLNFGNRRLFEPASIHGLKFLARNGDGGPAGAIRLVAVAAP